MRGSRHNATVATLLDMFLKANPGRDRSDAEKEEIARRYKKGEEVLPAVAGPRSPEELRAEEEDRRLLEEVRELSLREVGVEPSGGAREERSWRRRPESSRSGNESRRRSGSRRRGEVEARTRQIEYQSSIRSLISSADMSERDIEREIEEFARQIQEEGILDGLDLDNIDLARDDELSQRITEAYRRRQRERRSRLEAPRRRRGDSARSSSAVPGVRRDTDGRSAGRRRYSAGASVQGAERSRSQSATTRTGGSEHLEVQQDHRRRRRRTASSGRSSTTPVHRSPAASPAARSQSDLALQTRGPDSANIRPVLGENRTTGSPTVAVGTASPSENSNLSFASRVPRQLHLQHAAYRDPSPVHTPRSHRPTELSLSTPPTQSPLPSPSHKPPPLLFTEPCITCSRCSRAHIEYEIHYTCESCSDPTPLTLCLSCYRAGHGCRHWFGFGHDALLKWDRARQGNPSLPPPHKLWAGRYLPPRTLPIKDDNGLVQTGEDPAKRLQSGAFCDGCLAWASDCFWRCSSCNRGEWGFCNACVNQGRCCPHPLLPLSYQPQERPPGIVVSPPRRAAVAGGGGTTQTFRPLTFNTRCDVCRDVIPPAQARYHCYECVSSVEPDTLPGDYDVCCACYSSLVSRGQINPENGTAGWRRCVKGHRMVMIVFREGSDGQYRCMVRDLVGGRGLKMVPVDGDSGLEKWSWKERGTTMGRLVSVDVSLSAPGSDEGSKDGDGVVRTARFPPDGGAGMVVRARWGWLAPGGRGELYFPRGAEIREVEEINDEWFGGWYMGREGVFPAAYVIVVS